MYPGMMERPRVWNRTNTWAGAFGQNEDKADEMADARCEHVGWPGRANPPGDRAWLAVASTLFRQRLRLCQIPLAIELEARQASLRIAQKTQKLRWVQSQRVRTERIRRCGFQLPLQGAYLQAQSVSHRHAFTAVVIASTATPASIGFAHLDRVTVQIRKSRH
ncbi:hypothetical protein [Xanthomonas sp. 1678]|uniref:hypothetical protein n=1 Tax=Xanthomonas sp. 1678 TaxID=3158788 RepID=UPI0028644B5A|nr:hypothetical protein [Xanthomonas translucens]